MKLLLSLILINLGITAHAQEKNMVLLNIVFDNDVAIPKQASIEVIHFGNNQYSTDKLNIIGRSMVFKKNIAEPVLADLTIRWQNDALRFRFLLPVDTGTITIGANKKVTFDFKKHDALRRNYAAIQLQRIDLLKQTKEKIKNLNFENRPMTAVQMEIDSINNRYENELDTKVYKAAIYANTQSFVGAYALMEYAERPSSHQRRKFQTDSILNMYQMFPEEIKSLPSLKAFHKLLLAEKALGLGFAFPSFTLHDTLNQSQNLNAKLGKYTLIDFWANWCAPCRAEHPNLIKQYEKYKNSGFKILSVSIDKVADRNLWLAAISNDRVGRWPHFIDADNIAKQQLGINIIPSNFLLDSTGKVIARDLRGEDLNAKLSELFK